MQRVITFCLCLLVSGSVFSTGIEVANGQDRSAEPTADISTSIKQTEAETSLEPFRPTLTYNLGRVSAIVSDEEKELAGNLHKVQNIKAQIIRGPDKGQEVELKEHIVTQDSQRLKVGEKIIVVKQTMPQETIYYTSDKYRLPSFGVVFALFLVLAIIFARLKGLMAIVGLLVSLFILIQFIIPNIIRGTNPLVVSLIGAVIIAVLSLYLAHGFNKRSSIALLSTLITLGIATGLAVLFVNIARLTGLGSDEAFYLQLSPIEKLNLQGLLLGGIIIGALGVLDDVTTSQVAAVDEIHNANPSLPFSELYKRGLSVGQEHIASLVNTLVLAYAGASFPLFLLFTLNTDIPLWVKINNEVIVEEGIRTLVGSCALIFAVPIATFLAAFFFEGQKPSRDWQPGHSHSHSHK